MANRHPDKPYETEGVINKVIIALRFCYLLGLELSLFSAVILMGSQHPVKSQVDFNFIQPEGNAEVLPLDVYDRTKNLRFNELGPFLDETYDKLEKSLIPDARLEVYTIEHRVRQSLQKIQKERYINCDPDSLENDCQELYSNLIKNLVCDELDQCQVAMRKLSSNKLYSEFQSKNHLSVNRNLVEREFRFDAITSAVEELLRRLRSLIYTIPSSSPINGVHPSASSNASSNNSDKSDGWTEPDSSGSESSNLSDSEDTLVEVESNYLQHYSDSPLDPHPFASMKRKLKTKINVVTATSENQKKRMTYRRRNGYGASPDKKSIPEKRKRKFLKDFDDNHPTSSTSRQDKDCSIRYSAAKKLKTKKNTSQPLTKDQGDADSNCSFGSLSQKFDESNEQPDIQCQSATNQMLRLEKSLFVERNISRDPPTVENLVLASSKRIRSKREAISTRMQRFLNANREILSINTILQPQRSGVSRKKNLSNHRMNKENQAQQVNNQYDESADNQSVDGTKMDLFSTVFDTSSCQYDQVDVFGSEDDVQSLCAKLEKNYPHDPSNRIIHEICSKLNNLITTSQIHADLVFQTFLRILRTNGCRTLQDFVSSNSTFLDVHVSLLTCILTLLHGQCNAYLISNSDDHYKIFSQERSKIFVNLIVCQFVDSIMSVMNPCAWAISIANPRKVLDDLKPLRNAIGKMYCLIERVCQCLNRELRCQQWFSVRDGEHTFVSSLDPNDWQKYLTSFEEPRCTLEIRHHTFGNKIPRCEIEALWNVMAYCAQCTSSDTDSDSFRWNTISKLIFESSLTKCCDQNELPPGESQISAVISDIEKFKILVLSGSMCRLPKQDTILLELITRAVVLQANDQLHNEDSRLKSFPSAEKVTGAKEHLRSLWCDSDDIETREPASFCTMNTIALSLGHADPKSLWMGLPLCLPSSGLVQQMLGLLIAWKSQLPKNQPNRRKRFDISLRTIMNRFIDLSKEKVQKNDQHQGDIIVESNPFQEAFNSGSSKGGHATTREGFSLLESSIYMKLLLDISGKISDTNAAEIESEAPCMLQVLAEEVWALIANKTLQNRLIWINAENCDDPCPNDYCGDSYRLHIASRILTWLALQSLGILPFEVQFGESYTEVQLSPGEFDFNGQTFSFLLSCLLSCLDCSCDSYRDVEIMASVAGCIALLLKTLCRKINLDSSRYGSSLDKNIQPRLLRTFQRGFNVITTASYCGMEEDICLQSLLSLLRWTLKAAITLNFAVVSSTPNSSTPSFVDGSDDFADFDESILASMDFGQVNGFTEVGISTTIDRTQFLHKEFLNCLEQSNPNNRYAINETSLVGMSVQGKSLASKRLEWICSCLVLLVVARICPPSEIATLLRISYANDKDSEIQYRTQIAILVSVELCENSKYWIAYDVLRNHCSDILDILVEYCNDLSILRRLPSCNLVRMQVTRDEKEEERALMKLVKFSDRSANGKLRHDVDKLHKYCKNVALILFQQTNPSQSHTFDWKTNWNIDFDLERRWSHKIQPSLEQECFDYFRLFRRLLTLTDAEAQRLQIDRGKLPCSIIASSSRNVIRLCGYLTFQANAHKDLSRKSHSYLKQYEVCACCTEVFVSVLGLLYRFWEFHASDDLAQYLLWIWDQFVSPTLRLKEYDVRVGLRLLTNRSLNRPMMGNLPIMPLCETSEMMCELIRGCLVQRIRDFFIFSVTYIMRSQRNDHLLQDVFSFAATSTKHNDEDIGIAISNGFSRNFHIPTSTSSPLQSEIMGYISFIETHYTLNNEQVQGLVDLKHKAYRYIILPYLTKVSNDCGKIGMINILRCMLDAENNDNPVKTASGTGFDWPLLCSFGKGVITSLKYALTTPIVDEDIVASIYLCATSLFNIPTTCLGIDALGTIMDWCYTVSKTNGTDALRDPTQNKIVQYMWYLARWLHDVGICLFRCTEEDIIQLRFDLKDNVSTTANNNSNELLWNVSLPGQDPATSQKLIALENELFPKNLLDNHYKKPTTIRNVYATAKNLSVLSNIPLQTWTPSPMVRQSVIQFTSKVATASML